MTPLTVVPREGGDTCFDHPNTALSGAPAADPMDEVTRARLRRLIAGWLGEFATLDLHLDLLDARGAWYAEAALGAWTRTHPDSFFGVVRHVVRTQLPGPTPDPDLEGWLALGVPDEPMLAERWRALRILRHGSAARARLHPRTQEPVGSVARVDEIVRSWPDEHFDGFSLAYARLEQVLERRGVVLPPVTR
jgi:hypothetical protein